MDAVTYPTKTVIDFINQNVIPLRVASDHEMAKDYQVRWTPNLLIIDKEGVQHHQTVGFMEAEELIASILLGIGNLNFNGGDFELALACYDKLLSQYPGSDPAPEAIFQKGVSLYKSTGDPKPLREAYENLQDKYPASQWTKRAYPYRLIP